jgi:hypothetical protein
MKKLILLLVLAVVMVGFVSAGTVHPPWSIDQETADETFFAEYGIHEDAVTQQTVLVSVALEAAGFASISQEARELYNGIVWLPHRIGIEADYYLRC